MVTRCTSWAYVLVVLFLTFVSTATAKYSGGTGEPNDPYQIATAADLIALGETPEDYDKHFILTADIDLDPNLPGRKVFDKAVIAPDTNDATWQFEGTSFTGVFDGNGHTISHLTILGAHYVGLFGWLEGKVKDLGVVDANIVGSGTYVGGLAGCSTGDATNCHSTGTVNGGESVGGLAGYLYAGRLAQCYSTGAVNGTSRIGGVVGSSSLGSPVTECYSTGAVSGREYVGGLVGANGGDVANCHSIGPVSGTESVGGLVGINNFWFPSAFGHVIECYSSGAVSGGGYVGGLAGFNGAIISNCYSTGSVSGMGGYVGGLVGGNDAVNASVVHCYSTGAVSGDTHVGGLTGSGSYGPGGRSFVTASFWDTETSSQTTSAGGTGKTTAEMQTAKTFLDAGWDFVGETANGTEDIWKIAEGLGYPRLSWEKYSGGTGAPNDPYQIATAADLIALGETPEDYDKHFILTADIDLDPNLPGRKVFDRAVIAPKTAWGAGTPFTGVFDGNGHAISHLTISGEVYLGLFGQLGAYERGGEVKDLGVVDGNVVGSGSSVGGLGAGTEHGAVIRCYSTGTVSGKWGVGGLVGNTNFGVVTECYSSAAVSGDYSVGGLVGSNLSSITSSHSTGMVTGGSSVGGLVGENYYGAVTQCYSTGAVSGKDHIGGLVGTNGFWDTPGASSVTHCYSTGRVSGNSFIGGLVGYTDWMGTVTQCYSTGSVSGHEYVGGLVGGWVATTTACFWDIQTSGQATSFGGTGKTTAEMQTAGTFLDAGWDFVGETANGTEDIWWILEGKDYPRLWWEATNN